MISKLVDGDSDHPGAVCTFFFFLDAGGYLKNACTLKCIPLLGFQNDI